MEKQKILAIILVLILSFLFVVGVIYIINGFYQSNQLHKAVEDSDYNAAYTAINRGAWINKRKYILNIAEIVPTNPTPLISACKIGNEEIIELLIQNGADINKTDNFTGQTPLLAALHGGKANRYVLAMSLIEKGADIHISQLATSPLKESMIVLSIDDSQTIAEGFELFQYLIDHNVEIRTCNKIENVLTFASHYGNENVVKYLIENQYFDVNAIDPAGNTALIVASKYDQVEIVTLLLNYGADAELVNRSNKTALDFALENNNQELIAILQKSGGQGRDKGDGSPVS